MRAAVQAGSAGTPAGDGLPVIWLSSPPGVSRNWGTPPGDADYWALSACVWRQEPTLARLWCSVGTAQESDDSPVLPCVYVCLWLPSLQATLYGWRLAHGAAAEASGMLTPGTAETSLRACFALVRLCISRSATSPSRPIGRLSSSASRWKRAWPRSSGWLSPALLCALHALWELTLPMATLMARLFAGRVVVLVFGSRIPPPRRP